MNQVPDPVRDIERALDLVHRAQGAIDKDALSSLNVSPYMELAEALLPLHRAYHAAKELAARGATDAARSCS